MNYALAARSRLMCVWPLKVVHCDQTSVFTASIILHSEDVRRPLQRTVKLLLKVRFKYGNRIDCSFGAVFARWRWLGILSLARLARSQDEQRALN